MDGEVNSAPSGGLRRVDDDDAELTPRAILTGLAVGVLLAVTNTYLGLQSGWISMMSLQAALVGFGVFKVLPSRFVKRPLSVKENIVLQTTAVATGTMPLAAGLVGIIPALSRLTLEHDSSPPLSLTGGQIILWCLSVAFFGVFLAVPLRRQVIVREKLVFPSGTATAQMISVLHEVPPPREGGVRRRRGRGSSGYEALPDREEDEESVEGEGRNGGREVDQGKDHFDQAGWVALSWSFGVSAVYTLLSLLIPVLYAIPLFDIFGHLAHEWLWWFTPSFSYVGQGIIMGFPTTAAMNAGMLVGWAFLSPLAKKQGWAPGPVADSSTGSRGWIIWPALAIMMAEALVSVSSVTLVSFASYLRSRRHYRSLHSASSADPDSDSHSHEDAEGQEDELGLKWVVGGLVGSSVLCIVLIWGVFGNEGIRWWATVVALILACLFSLLGVRSLGETDLNPVSAIGKISQLLFALIQPGNVVANLLAGGISEAGAQQAGDLMQDLKTGHLHGASPKVQFVGQMIGSFVSVFVSTGVYMLYRKELFTTAYPVPVAAVWLSLARLVNTGHLPSHSKEAMLVLGPLFFLITSLRALYGSPLLSPSARRSIAFARFLPSGIAFAIGFINTPSFSIARLIGGVISLVATRRRLARDPQSSGSPLDNILLIVVASGFVLGEGFASIVGLLARSGGMKPLSCWGCDSGGGGYCGGC